MTIPVLLVAAAGMGLAASTVYQEQNFSIDFPEGWTRGAPPPYGLALVMSPDETKGFAIGCNKVPADKISAMFGTAIASQKNAAANRGGTISGEHDQVIGGVNFRTFLMTLPDNSSSVVYVGAAGQLAYSINGFSTTSVASEDPGIMAVINSFRLLAPAVSPTAPLSQEADRDGLREGGGGNSSRKAALMALAAGVVFTGVMRILWPKFFRSPGQG